jgi:paraquat-inducible protein B
MSQKANPTAIGIFIVLGLTLTVGALVMLNSDRFFREHQKFILYFDASLKGLNVGAPVKYRGVTIGSLSEVLIHHNQATNDFFMPVIVDIDLELAQSKSDEQFDVGSQLALDKLVKLGLRGKLDAESLVTGVLYVQLDIVPKASAPVMHQLQHEYTEIPTMPTEIQQLLSNLARLDIGGISDKLNALLTRLDSNLAQLDVQKINTGMTNLLNNANQLLTSTDLTNTVASLKVTLEHTQRLMEQLDCRVNPMADSVTNTLAEAQKTLQELRTGIQHLNGMIEPDAPARAELLRALAQFSNASRAVSDLADFLERNPNALLTGRKEPKQ